jgi:hypothetical protein
MHRLPWFLLFSACAVPQDESRFARHFDGPSWGGAFVAQTEQPGQLVPELTLLGASAATALLDQHLQQEATEDAPITEGSTANGDGVMYGLTAIAGGAAVGEWINGDDARAFEVLAEGSLLTAGVTGLLKRMVGRERPAGGSGTSFPSSHTSWAFSMATFLQRRISDSYDGWVGSLGYLVYAPAAYVGINRVEADRHWPSDVAFGAFLGVLLTNVVYDAHYGGRDRPGIFGVRGLSLRPELGPDGAGLALELRF